MKQPETRTTHTIIRRLGDQIRRILLEDRPAEQAISELRRLFWVRPSSLRSARAKYRKQKLEPDKSRIIQRCLMQRRHNYDADGICIVCGFKRPSPAEYLRAWKSVNCGGDGCFSGYKNHRYKDGKCIRCGAKEPTMTERHTKWRQQFKKEKKQ